MKTITNHAANELVTLSTTELAATTGGTGKPVIFDQAAADDYKRMLDRAFHFNGKDPGRAVARTVPGHPGQYTVETPRLDGHGRRETITNVF